MNLAEIRPVILGRFGPPTLAAVRSWGRLGARVGLIAIQSKDSPPIFSRHLHEWTALPSDMLYTNEGIDLVAEFLERFKADGFVAMQESIACWIQDHREALPKRVALWMPDSSTLRSMISKSTQIELARAVGLRVLPTFLLDSGWEQNLDGEALDFPLCLRPCKPGDVHPFLKVKLIHSREALTTFLRGLDRIEGSIVAQPFMSLPNLVVHGSRTRSGEVLGLAGFLVDRKFEGVTLFIRPIALKAEIRQKCVAFLEAARIVGPFHFEFLLDPKTQETWFLEINTRLGGTTAKVLACGYDEPALALAAYGVSCRVRSTANDCIATSKQALFKYLYYAVLDRLTPLDYPTEGKWTRVMKALWALVRYKDDVFTMTDLRGSLCLYVSNWAAKLTA